MDKKSVEREQVAAMATAMGLDYTGLTSVPNGPRGEVPPDVALEMTDGTVIGVEVCTWADQDLARYSAHVLDVFAGVKTRCATLADAQVILTPKKDASTIDKTASIDAMEQLFDAGTGSWGSEKLPAALQWVEIVTLNVQASPDGAPAFVHWTVHGLRGYGSSDTMIAELNAIIRKKEALLPRWHGNYSQRWLLIPTDDPGVKGTGSDQWITNEERDAVVNGLQCGKFDRVVILGAGLTAGYLSAPP